ncbi:hypothetical protein SESBI_44221 [Sesbania bispinosa]|nr:hypothetical protein SESBI_44221 [Sesbania bispinosa]
MNGCPKFFYNYGRIGHDEDMCKENKSDALEEEEEETKTFGPWMRASQFGRKLNSKSQYAKDTPREAQTRKVREGLSRDITDLLAALSFTNNASSSMKNTEPETVPNPSTLTCDTENVVDEHVDSTVISTAVASTINSKCCG